MQRRDINRIIASALAFGGSIWALVLLYLTLQFLKEAPSIIDAMFFNLLFLPGWVIYSGWWIRSFNTEKKEKGWTIFWIGSAIVHLAYFLISSGFDSQYSPYIRGWWILALFLSLLALRPDREKLSKIN